MSLDLYRQPMFLRFGITTNIFPYPFGNKFYSRSMNNADRIMGDTWIKIDKGLNIKGIGRLSLSIDGFHLNASAAMVWLD